MPEPVLGRHPWWRSLALALLSVLTPAPAAAVSAAGANPDAYFRPRPPEETSAAAMETMPPLLPEAVMRSARDQFPKVLQALAKQAGVEGKALASQGAFDLVFDAKGFSRTAGFYNGTALSGRATQPLGPFGAEVYSGYKISNGIFPIYEDVNFTNTGGQASIGVLFSLLKNRSIDDRRFGIRDAELAVRQGELEVLLTRVGVQQQALATYWRWVIAARQLLVYESLLDLALFREVGLKRQVEQGARARIFLTENEQNIMRRRILVANAQRDYDLAANRLSLYLRDADGQPLLAVLGQLPPEEPPETLKGLAGVAEDGVRAALASRPELEQLRVGARRAQRRIALKQNNLQPKLDFSVERMRPFGTVAEGGTSRDSVDTIVGLTFEVPLQRRKARGELSAEQAGLRALEEETRLLEDQIELEISNLLIRLNVARDLLGLAATDATLSDTMREAELKRFDSGASDFFLVNLREETAFNARVRYLRAALDLHLARVVYDAATVDLPRLGLSDLDD
ncbi:MAG: TolC family protein [Pseudomonadota bacterium]